MASANGRKARRRKVKAQVREAGDLFTEQLKAAAEKLRSEVAHVEGELGQQAGKLAQELEEVAVSWEKRAESGAADAKKAVKSNPWPTIIIAFLAGVLIGVIIRNYQSKR